MKAITHTVNEIDPKFEGAWILSLRTSFLHINILGFESEHISLVFGDKTGNFTSSEHRVDGLEEALTLDLRVGHNEGDLFAEGTSLSVEIFNIVLEMNLTIGLSESDLEEHLLANERSELSEGLFTGTTNTD